MSKQPTLSAFFKVGLKSSTAPSTPPSKKIKLDDEKSSTASSTPPAEKVRVDFKNAVIPEENSGNNTVDRWVNGNCSSPNRKPHEIRQELISLSRQFPIISKNVGLTWYPALIDELKKPSFSLLNEFVLKERSRGEVYPPAEKVWTWTQACRMDEVKAVILGQDPYHNPGQAHGLCFSVQIGVPPPPSLLNMYKELEKDIEGFQSPKHGHLIGWARQGVLLLNAVLTVTKNNPNSHKDKGWESLTSAVIKHLNDKFSGIVFFLWGSYAQKKADFVDQKKHLVLKSVHPSPLSAHRGYFGCRHFSKCNEYLIKCGKTPINWSNLPPE